MSKSIKLKDNFLIDSKSIAVNRENLYDFLFYKSNDKFITSNTIVCGAYFSSSASRIYITIVTPKRLTNIKTITLNSISCNIRDITGYVTAGGREDTNWLKNDFTAINISKSSDNTLFLYFTGDYKRRSSTTGIDNNSTSSMEIRQLELTFN